MSVAKQSKEETVLVDVDKLTEEIMASTQKEYEVRISRKITALVQNIRSQEKALASHNQGLELFKTEVKACKTVERLIALCNRYGI